MLALITGCAGFIGHHLTARVLDDGWEVFGIDNFDPYYNVKLKEANLKTIGKHVNFRFAEFDINRSGELTTVFDQKPDIIIHLAAKAGVGPSFSAPVDYAKVNINGTLELLKYAQQNEIKRIVFASSSSVYGDTDMMPFSEEDPGICPISPYGMTKYHGENFCRLYTELYGIEINALRFFTVYGPCQRPDMAINKFIRKIQDGEEIKMYGSGEMFRDYTYIDDIVDGIIRSTGYFNGFNIFNLGNGTPVKLNEMITEIGELLEQKPVVENIPTPAGEMDGTYADITKAKDLLGYEPKTGFREGVAKEIEWIKKNRDLLY
jgi:UDP-glucuronate 4-epimerase